MEGSQRYHSSGQSSRKRERSEAHDGEDIVVNQQEAKRRRKSEPQRIYDAFTHASIKVCSKLWDFFEGSKNIIFGSSTPKMAKKETKRSDLNIGLDDDDDNDDIR